MSKTIYVIAGPNGAGKTTFAKKFLPQFAHCEEFVNADMIATGLSPLAPANAALSAGRTMLRRIQELIRSGKSFGFETTLSGKNYATVFRKVRSLGYRVEVVYLWLPNSDLALQRVRDRVRQGGHDIPEKDVRRRYTRGLWNLFHVYRKIIDQWALLDNSGSVARSVASELNGELVVADEEVFGYIRDTIRL